MSEPGITIRFQPTEADHYRASRDVAAQHWWLRAMLWSLPAATVLLIALSVRAGFTLPIAVFRNVFWIIVSILFWIWFPLADRLRARRVMRKAAKAGLGEVVIRFDEDGVHFGSPPDNDWKWSDVRRVVETDHSMLLFVTWRAAAFFPVAAARKDGTLEATRQLLRRHLGDRAKLK